MSLIDTLVNRFREERFILASLWTNAEITRVGVEYEPDKVTLNNLDEDLPPFIRLWKEGEKVEGSLDRIEWVGFDQHESKELQIYRLLDPTFVLPRIHIERKIETKSKLVLIDGSYAVEKLDLPPILAYYFKEEKNLSRWTRLQVLDGWLLSMSQQDFPPYRDTITLVFRGPVPYYF